MDMRLVLCAVVAVVVVDARSPPVPQCLIFCPNGFAPGSRCVCNDKPGVSSCDGINCGINKRCVELRSGAKCVPRRPTYPSGPAVPRCRKYCRYGFVPGTFCKCKTRPGVSPCHLKQCGLSKRCVVRGTRAVCIPRRVCYQPKIVGRCRAAFPRYFYNRKTQRCESFIYGGCGGNDNNFRTLQACRKRCERNTRPARY